MPKQNKLGRVTPLRDEDDTIETLVIRWREAAESGEPTSPEEVCRDHPELIEAVALAVMDREFEGVGIADLRADDPTEFDFNDDPRRGGSEVVLRAGAEPVPGYRLVAGIGTGGSGEVWEAIGPGGVPVALKFVRLSAGSGVLEPSGEASESLRRASLRSLQLMRSVRHANLLPTFGAWRRGGVLILGMELADGTLRDRLDGALAEGHPGIPAAELLEFMRQAALGIDYLNGRLPIGGKIGPAIQHRDVKPQNLLVIGGSVKVGDFGLVKLLEDAKAADHTGSLTPAYAAPELFDGRVSRNSDQYALAVTYCKLRGNRAPFVGTPYEVMLGHFRNDPDLGMVPPAERPVVARALEKDPEDRWPDCRSFVEALALAVALPEAGGPSSAFEPATPRPESATSALSRVLGRLLIVAALVPMALIPPEPGRPPAPTPRPHRISGPIGRPSSMDFAPMLARIEEAASRFGAWFRALPVEEAEVRPDPEPAPLVLDPAEFVGPPLPRTATVRILMPTAKAELAVRGAVGRGRPDEWYGPVRVIHTPPRVEPEDYRIGAFWTTEAGEFAERSRTLRVEPGHQYEVDLRFDDPTWRELDAEPSS